MHNAGMVSITIRDVPQATRDELAARAARSGRSLQEYVRGELVALAEEPDHEAVLARIRERVSRTGVRLTAETLLEAKDADRR
jgi:plasmid stability protein